MSRNTHHHKGRGLIWVLLLWIVVAVGLCLFCFDRLTGGKIIAGFFTDIANVFQSGEIQASDTPEPSTPPKVTLSLVTPAMPTPTFTPTPTLTPTPTFTPTPTPTPLPTFTPTPTPTPLPTATPTPLLSAEDREAFLAVHEKDFGELCYEERYYNNRYILIAYPEFDNTKVTEAISAQTENICDEITALWDDAVWQEENGEACLGAVIDYESYNVGIYSSVLFSAYAVDRAGNQTMIYEPQPYVYNMETGKRQTGRDLFQESYFPIVKMRVMQWIKDNVSASEYRTGFLTTYSYDPQDYDNCYLTEDSVRFCFAQGELDGVFCDMFTYATDLTEARAFMKTDIDGSDKSSYIRTDLDTSKPMLAFTFDDGPNPASTKRIMETFEAYDGRCTFFVVGTQAKRYPETVKEAYDAGHEIATHTDNHIKLTAEDVSEETLWTEVNNGVLRIAKACGCAPYLLRAPYGAVNDYMKANLPYVLMNWRVDSKDWESRNTEAILAEVSAGVKNSSGNTVILMHDIHVTTADAIETVVPYFAELGYQFVTVSELLYYRGDDVKLGDYYTYSKLK